MRLIKRYNFSVLVTYTVAYCIFIIELNYFKFHIQDTEIGYG